MTPPPPATKYARLIWAQNHSYLASDLRQIATALTDVWATMTDQEKRAEPVVREDHYRELKAKGLL